jgi:hypothetical protein
MKKSIFTTISSMFLLGACGIMPNRASVASLPGEAFVSEKSGVVILSTGAPDTCASIATFLKVFEANSKKLVDSAPLIPVDAYTNKSEFTDHHGLINAVELPAGDYYVSPWAANPHVVAIKTPTFAFNVRAGETVYIGELFMPRSCGFSTTLVVRDKFDRDVKLAIEKNPLVGQRAMSRRLMQASQQ